MSNLQALLDRVKKAVRQAPSLDENGYIAEKAEILKAIAAEFGPAPEPKPRPVETMPLAQMTPEQHRECGCSACLRALALIAAEAQPIGDLDV